MKIDAELFDVCKDFIKDNKIVCGEDIYQRDSIEANALDLIEQICDLIGYYEEEDEEELDFDEE
jgi:hypothetical protein